MTLSVVITTRNEAANIANCIRAFDGFRNDVEIIVVDNGSTDDTKGIAASLGAKVLDKGPERSAQRNLGWRTAVAPWVVILDADMILPRKTIEEMLACVSRDDGIAAYWIPEVRTGNGIRVKARNFERSFYDGTCIDALRLFSKEVLEKTGGYDENLIAGPEDWELDIRVLETGAKCEVLKNHLITRPDLSCRSRLIDTLVVMLRLTILPLCSNQHISGVLSFFFCLFRLLHPALETEYCQLQTNHYQQWLCLHNVKK